MNYEIVDLDGGDVLGVYEQHEAAIHRARLLAEEAPEIAEDLAVIALDDSGRRVGEPVMLRDTVAA